MSGELIYLGHDNTFSRVLKEDGSPVDLSGVSRMTITIGNYTIDSNADGNDDAFDWDQGNGVVEFALGGQELLAGDYQARIVVYDNVNVNGIVWPEFSVTVIGTYESTAEGTVTLGGETVTMGGETATWQGQ